MSAGASLIHDGRLKPGPIAAAAASGDALEPSGDSAADAAIAIAAGLRGDAKLAPMLLGLADDDGLAARAAGWALGQLDCEQALCDAATNGGLDLREQAYRALAGLAARGAASDNLAALMRARVDAELERAAKGLTSLAEHATRVLAVLGAADTQDLIARVISEDSLADRFELERQRKQVEAEGLDQETIKELTGDWTELFADDLADDSADSTEPEPEIMSEQEAAAAPVAPKPTPAPAPQAAAPHASNPTAHNEPKPDLEGLLGADEPDPGAPDDAEDAGPEMTEAERNAQPVDWEAFATSPECTALEDNLQMVAKQFGPMLEQLTAQVASMPLTAITGQELAGLLLQVLPQAAPPQVVQAALSPQGLNALQAVATFLARTGAAVHGTDLITGIKLVRQTMREQIRQSGMLGGPDYSDPDEAVGDTPPTAD